MAEIPPVDLRSTCAYLLRMKVLGQKQAVNRSVDAQLLKEARDDGVNLSSVLELALAQERARRWLAENKSAIEACNRRIDEHGVWSDGWRRW